MLLDINTQSHLQLGKLHVFQTKQILQGSLVLLKWIEKQVKGSEDK